MESKPVRVRNRRKGTVPTWLRKQVFKRDDQTCVYCGKWGVPLTCDHVIPKWMGGPTTYENLVTACWGCNQEKGGRLTADMIRKANDAIRKTVPGRATV